MKNYTTAQKLGLLEMLEAQTSPMTESEATLLAELQATVTYTMETEGVDGNSNGVGSCAILMETNKYGTKVRQINMDTFGEDYRNRWVKVKESGKGSFFNMRYFGSERIYLNEYSLKRTFL